MASLIENSNSAFTKDNSAFMLNKSDVKHCELEPETNSERLSFDSTTLNIDLDSAVQELDENHIQSELENKLPSDSIDSNITEGTSCLSDGKNTINDLETVGHNHPNMASLIENSNSAFTKDNSAFMLNKSNEKHCELDPETNSERLSFDSTTLNIDLDLAVQELDENHIQSELENKLPSDSNITEGTSCLSDGKNTITNLETDRDNHINFESSKKKSRLSFLSDSESDEEPHKDVKSSAEQPLPGKKVQSTQNTEETVSKSSNKTALWDSESDEEIHNDIQSSAELQSGKNIESTQNINETVCELSDQTARKSLEKSETSGLAKKSRFLSLVDSESDEEPHNDTQSSVEPLSGKKNLSTQNTENETVCEPRKKSTLWDSESDEEQSSLEPLSSEKIPSTQTMENETGDQTATESLENSETNKKVTAKEVKELRKEIQSESQRMLREKNLSLPYHRPKAHSLKEFLSRRPKLALASTNGSAPPSIAMKMSVEQLDIISKKLEKREKEVQEFYQSESESEKEDDDCMRPAVDKEQSNKSDGNVGDNLDSSTLPETSPEIVLTEEKSEKEHEMDTNATKTTICPEHSNEENTHPNSDVNLDDSSKNHSNDIQKACDIKNNATKSTLSMLKENLSKFTPQLSGRLEKTIDLNSALARPREVVDLMERFVKHATTKKHTHSKVKNMSIVTVESGGNIQKETVAMNLNSDDEADGVEEIPGAKLQRLKQELHKYMDDKKTEIWKQKMAKPVPEKEESCKDDDQLDDDQLDDEEEELFSNEEDLTEESESETENDTSKNEFMNLEAEESLDEPIRNEEVEDSNSKCSEPQENDMVSESENELHNSEKNEKHTFSRIQQLSDDSDEEDAFAENTFSELKEQLDSTVTADEDDIPAHQPRQLQTPMRPALSQVKSISDFLTPVSFITSIQNLASATKGNKNDSAVSPSKTTSNPSSQDEGLGVVQKQLFTNSQESVVTESLSSLQCISDGSSDQIALRDIQSENNQPPSTQDLMEICSGGFTGVNEDSTKPSQSDVNEESTKPSQSEGSEKNDSDHDMVITQLLDEEELENFKKKFESPVHRVTQKSVVSERQEVSGGAIIDSDDESQKIELKKKRNKKRIQYSDDESSEEEHEQQEEIDLVDKDDLEDNLSNNSDFDSDQQEVDKNKLIDYDSEENDITQENYVKRPADFFDAEAELSESEWGSEDEDEKGLDELEFELADTEVIDEKQVKEDLEKIHMRRMLDDDVREVQLLQEMYLEDGEMHGTGRQKQFKWKNIDSADFPANENENDEEIYLDEEESEEQWRKKRHEREMFFKGSKEQTSDTEDEDLLTHSQLLKIGKQVLKRSFSSNQTNSQNHESENTVDIPEPISKTPIISLTKRGSFLNRSDEVLQRVAEHTKISAAISLNSSKNTKNFLFISSSSETVTSLVENKKRKAIEQTPKALKKLRLNNKSVKKKLPAEKSKDDS